jgi:cysteine desulfurase/selenocysteine lyase
LERMIYLDNAATTFPKPVSILETSFHIMKQGAGNPGRGSHAYAVASAEIVEKCRRKVARFFGVEDHRRVIFTYNCTDSINMTLKGLLKEGSHVITTNLDHNSVARPLHSLGRQGVEVTRIPFDDSGRVDTGRCGRELRENTALMVLNHGSNVLGSVQDWTEFLSLGVPILLDAAQTAGRIPILIGKAPVFVAFSAHKALFGLPGLGVLIVPPDADLRAWREGGSGSASEKLEHPMELPMHLEAGTPNFLSIASLLAGLEFMEQESIDRVHERERKLAARLVSFLRADDRFVVYSSFAPQDLAVIAFNIRNVPPEEAGAILDQRFGIAVRAGLHCAAVLHEQLGTLPDGCLRVSPGYFNTEEDMAALVEALKAIAEGYH